MNQNRFLIIVPCVASGARDGNINVVENIYSPQTVDNNKNKLN